MINVYQPAGNIEEFFRRIGKFDGKPHIHEALNKAQMQALFHEHGMEITGPPLVGKWAVDKTEGSVKRAGCYGNLFYRREKSRKTMIDGLPTGV